MVVITSAIKIDEQINSGGLREIVVTTPATANANDTYTVTLANHGISNLQTFNESVHTTANSVIAVGASTTAVAAGVLTVTLGVGASKIRVARIGGN